jgi:hypothetical protein
VPNRELIEAFERARENHLRAVEELVPLAIRMAIENLADVLPGARELEAYGEINEDWLPILRIRRVLGTGGAVLFDVEAGHDVRAVEDRIDTVNADYLDLLLDLTGDDFMGGHTIDFALADTW